MNEKRLLAECLTYRNKTYKIKIITILIKKNAIINVTIFFFYVHSAKNCRWSKGLRLNPNDDDQGIVDVSESSGLNNVFEIQNRLSEILTAAFFSLSLSLSLCAKSRRATPQSAVKQRRKPKINVSSLPTTPSFACSLCIRAQRVQSAAWITHQSVSLLACVSIFPCVSACKKPYSVRRDTRLFIIIVLIDATPFDAWSRLNALRRKQYINMGLPL